MSFTSEVKRIWLVGAVAFCACTTLASPSYHDPVAGPGVTFYNAGGAAGSWVDFLPDPFSTGVVKVGYWVFTVPSDPGYYYAYELRNINAGNLGGAPAGLRFYELDNIAPHLDLGNGGGKHGGLNFISWAYNGDGLTTALWNGGASSAIMPGETSPTATDVMNMYEINSNYAYGSGMAQIVTTSGGGYTGQSVSVWVPVPEPGGVTALLTGALALVGFRLRKK